MFVAISDVMLILNLLLQMFNTKGLSVCVLILPWIHVRQQFSVLLYIFFWIVGRHSNPSQEARGIQTGP
jgi:hypothetical protein